MRADRMKSWFEAAPRRHSRRTYTSDPADAAVLDRLAATCEGFHPYSDARVALVEEPATDIFTGVIGAYGKVTGAPHLLCMIADTNSPQAQQHTGYVGEAAVLEAASLGLDTCWIGGFFDPDKASRLVRLTGAERIVAVSPVGIAREDLSSTERTMRAMSSARQRKPLEKIALDDIDGWPAWALAALKCARIAPSAMNRQPWRFRYRNSSLLVYRDSPIEVPKVTKALDCGIAMLHAELGALSEGVSGHWEDLTGKSALARFALADTSGD